MGLPATVRDIRVTAAGGRTLLDLPQLDIAAGASIAIAGPSGAGKSTLLHVLSGLITPQTGTVQWGETELTTLSPRALQSFRRATMGLVFQDHLLIGELGPRANATIAARFLPRAARARIERRAADLLARLNVPVDATSVSTLSGGERQRVALARALAPAPKILLADEPTASLDRDTADALIDDLIQIAGEAGMTLICVSHDPVLIARMDRCLHLSNGRMVEGAP